MSDKPSYLGLLNAVAVGEVGGECLFTAWAAATPNDDVRAVLQTVALREGEHAKSFAKRINELGYTVRDKVDPGLTGRVAMASSTTLTDCEKFEGLGFARPADSPDIFAGFFADTTIDIRTGELLGRYLSEERDTGRMLRSCYTTVSAEAASRNGTAAAPADDIGQRLERIECALAALAGSAPSTKTKTKPESGSKKKAGRK